MIDVNKPLELENGTPVTFVRIDDDGDIVVRPRGFRAGNRCFHKNGKHIYGDLPDLRNVALPEAPAAPAEPFDFIDVSVEVARTYTFPNGKVMIDAPVKLHVSPTHSHRLIDAQGASHYVPAGWLHLTWTVKPGSPNFVA